MWLKHMVYRCLTFTVSEDKQPILVGVYWSLYNFNNVNIHSNCNKNCISF